MLKRLSIALIILWCLTLTGFTAQLNRLSRTEIDQGWILLFDGESLFGWEAGSDVNWHVQDGSIRATEGSMGLLHTRAEFSDFQLVLEFKASPGTNSGVFLRSAPICPDPGPNGQCYELNIAPSDNPFPTGSIVQYRKVENQGETAGWRTYDILVQGDRIDVLLDGEELLDLKLTRPLGRGHV
jgi:hypothetical protein